MDQLSGRTIYTASRQEAIYVYRTFLAVPVGISVNNITSHDIPRTDVCAPLTADRD